MVNLIECLQKINTSQLNSSIDLFYDQSYHVMKNMAKGCSLQTVNRGLSRGIVRILILLNSRRPTSVWIFFLTFTATSNSLFGFSKFTCVAGKEVIIHFTVGLRHVQVHDRQKGGNFG